MRFAIVFVLAGCGTVMNGTAPAPRPGAMYVVGAKGNAPAVWLCGEQPGPSGECREVELEIER